MELSRLMLTVSVLAFVIETSLAKNNRFQSVLLNDIPEDEWNHPDCQVDGRRGSCVFSMACTFSKGEHLGICKHKIFFGSCCQLKRHLTDQPQTSTRPPARPRPPIAAVVAEEDENEHENEITQQLSPQCGLRSPISNLNRKTPSTSDLWSLWRFFQNLHGGHREARIIGGSPAAFGSWPWQVNMELRFTSFYSRHRCGAVLLSSQWVLTAAHCVEGFKPNDFLLKFGDHDIAKDNEPLAVIERKPEKIIVHPDFDPITYENDVALLFISDRVPFSSSIVPVCLPDKNQMLVPGTLGYTTGWGTEYEGGPKPNVLNEVPLPIYDHDRCNRIFQEAKLDEALTDVFICAGYKTGGKDACEGDSGGPLVVQSQGLWTLVGIVSWGRGCGEPNQPGVYTNIHKFRAWIDSHTI